MAGIVMGLEILAIVITDTILRLNMVKLLVYKIQVARIFMDEMQRTIMTGLVRVKADTFGEKIFLENSTAKVGILFAEIS
jgi:hypothetical protein